MKKYLVLFFVIVLLSSCVLAKRKTTPAFFSDDFSKGLTENWTIESHTFENNLAHFSAANVKIAENKLVLILDASKHMDKLYTGAEIRSKASYLYGKFEVRMKATQTLGCITAFFLYRPTGENNQEIDFEISGKFPNTVTLNHWVDKKSHVKDIELPFNTTSDYHNYTIIWEPQKITWQVDGTTIYSTTEAVPNKAMHVIFNLWATKSTKWAGDIKEAKLPASAFIDEVKFYPYQKIK